MILLEEDILDLLPALVEKSLVIYEEDQGQGRYRLLETVRQYSQDRREAEEEETDFGRQHRDYFLVLAEEAYAHLSGPDQTYWLDRLETEHDNLRAALETCLFDPEGSEKGLRLAGI